MRRDTTTQQGYRGVVVKPASIVLAILGTTACQGPESESDVLYDGFEPIAKEIQFDPLSYGDLVAAGENRTTGDALKEQRFVIKVEHSREAKKLRVLVVPVHNSSGRKLGQCVSLFLLESDSYAKTKEGEPYEAIIEKSKVVKISFNKNTNNLAELVVFATKYKSKKNHEIVYNYISTGPDKMGKAHKITDKGKFDQKYFPEDMQFCEDSSPSGNGTNSPQRSS